MSPSSKYYFSYLQSRYQSPAKVESQSNRSTVNQSHQDELDVVGPQQIRIIMQIGKGSFGDVYLVEKRLTNRVGPK